MNLQARAERWLLRLPRRTVRVRLTLLYSAVFLVSGALLLTITNLLVTRAIHDSSVSLPLPPGGHAIVSISPGSSPSLSHPEQFAIGIAGSAIRKQAADDLHLVLVVSGIALAIMAVLSAVLGWLVAGRVLRPLQIMTNAARQISENNLHERLSVGAPADELTDLAGTINGLLARLEVAFDAQRRFVANASHELRTPLAMMRTSLDVAAAKPEVPAEVSVLAAKLGEGLDQSERLLESFLTLARAEYGANGGGKTTVALGEVLAAAIETRSDAITSRGVRVKQPGGEVWVRGDSTLLARMAGNLVDNAIRHNVPGGWACAEISSYGTTARLIVENGGPILTEDAVQELAQPFRRLGADRTGSASGTGLGLSIVEAIVSAHSGSLRLHARPQGGLRVIIELPLASAPRPAPTWAGDRI